MLPTEEQWQYAAQGDTEQTYPWGNNWDCDLCNNSVKPCSNTFTVPVLQYVGRGDSPFNVSDMVGNVWEWCLTDNISEVDTYNGDYVLRGGSWYDRNSDRFRCTDYIYHAPHFRSNFIGFRISTF